MKRPVNELVQIIVEIYRDLAMRCHTESCDVQMDLKTIQMRFEHEGLSFFTITLPNFCRDFERSLEEGQVGRDLFVGLKRYKCLPAFLRGFTLRIFSPHDGGLLDEPCIESVRAVRQICLAAKKIKLPCAPHREVAAIQDYIETEQKLSAPDWESTEAKSYASVSRMLIQNVFHHFDIRDILPHQGPGAVYEGLRPNQKYDFLTWPESFADVFPYDWFACCNLNHAEDTLPTMSFLTVEEELPIRLATVPKTQKAPRIIGIEAAHKMFVQQALKTYMYVTLENHWITSGHVNFTDQSINQRLALTNSVDQESATLDMKKASDLVLVDHVEVAYSGVPELLTALMTSRSTDVELPSGEYLHLRKFASMGSATCFPVEALHFFTICCAALLDMSSLPHTLENIKRVSRGVYVYGDDVIVPTDAVEWVLRYMNRLGSVVNVDKSFYKGYFRESCGMDAYMGERVTPIYIRNLPPQDSTDGPEIASYVSLGNQLYKAGYDCAFNCVRSIVDKRNGTGQLPSIADETSPGLYWLKPFKNPESYYRFRKSYQRREIRVPQLIAKRRKDPLDGWPALLKWFLSRGLGSGNEVQYSFLAPFDSRHGKIELSRVIREIKNGKRSKDLFPLPLDERHLESSVRRGAVSIKSRWVEDLVLPDQEPSY